MEPRWQFIKPLRDCTPRFLTEVLAHYRTLPAIEQAQYPDNYESRLQAKIDEKELAAKGDLQVLSLFEVLAYMRRPGKSGDDKDASQVTVVQLP